MPAGINWWLVQVGTSPSSRAQLCGGAGPGFRAAHPSSPPSYPPSRPVDTTSTYPPTHQHLQVNPQPQTTNTHLSWVEYFPTQSHLKHTTVGQKPRIETITKILFFIAATRPINIRLPNQHQPMIRCSQQFVQKIVKNYQNMTKIFWAQVFDLKI